MSHLFGGLWYHPPFSDDFETYFGLEPKEARYFFCYNDTESTFSAASTSELHSSGYLQCTQENFSGNCRETKEYVQGNVYRLQLLDSINKSINDPFNDQELVPVNKCSWESMSGLYNAEMDTKLIDWKNQGYELAVYFESDHARCEGVATARIPLNTRVTVAARHCTKF